MKKVLMFIFVLSLLGLLAVPVLAHVLAGPEYLIGPAPGIGRTAGVESPVQVALRGFWREAGVENPVQIAIGGMRPPAPRG